MFKDPNHQAETPYDILGLTPEATSADVQPALVRFMKNPKNLPRLAKAQEAVKKLKSPRERAAIDIWYYDLELSDQSGDASELGLSAEDLPRVPVLPYESLYNDLEGADLAKDQRPIEFLSLEIVECPPASGLGAIPLRPRYDR